MSIMKSVVFLTEEVSTFNYNDILSLGVVSAVVIMILLFVFTKLRGDKIVPESYESNGVRLRFEKEPVEQLTIMKQPEFDYSNPIRLRDLSFEVKDKRGKALSEKTVSISAKTSSGEEALVGNLVATTNSNGIATFSGVTMGLCGNLSISAECEGKQCSSVAFDIPDTTGPVKTLRFEEPPSRIDQSSDHLAPVNVKVLNANDIDILGQTVQLSVLDDENTNVLQGTLFSVSDERGIALFSNLFISKPGIWRLSAECGDARAESEEFEITDLSVDTIRFMKSPNDSEVKKKLNSVVVRVYNSERTPLSKKTIILSLRDRQEKECVLIGMCSRITNERGEAVFDDLSVGKIGFYRITASCEEITCESREFEITPPGIDFDLENYEYGTDEYWDTLRAKLLLNNKGDKIYINGEEI